MYNFDEVVPQSKGFNNFYWDRVTLGKLRNKRANNANSNDGEY